MLSEANATNRTLFEDVITGGLSLPNLQTIHIVQVLKILKKISK